MSATQPHALLIGAGLGALATALRLSSRGYRVTILEQYHQPGGRLNLLEKDGFRFDIGPSFFSMSYEFDELFKDCGVENPLQFNELNPIYTVYIRGREKPFQIYKDLERLAAEFEALEPNFKHKVTEFLRKAGEKYHDTENIIIKRNFNSKLDYLLQLARVPLKHAPGLFKNMWTELEEHFSSEEVKVIFSLCGFFLGSTPFETPAVYTLLNYTELVHDGYYNVKGGMYSIVTEMVKLLEQRGVEIHCNTRVIKVEEQGKALSAVIDQHGKRWTADIFIANADAASFRGKFLNRPGYTPAKLDKMQWTLAPFTIYLGVKGKVPGIEHHNYFLGNNFRAYADKIFKLTEKPEQPYYYVNVSSKSNPETAPEGCENLFILCPVPDRRYKANWPDAEQLADDIIRDLGERVGYDLAGNTLTRTVLTPVDWENMFSLYRGSGLGLGHGLLQVGALRPSNKDEVLSNLYYVGASTTPGTGLPIVVIGSKLVTERIEANHGTLQPSLQ